MKPLWDEGLISYYQIKSLGSFQVEGSYTKHQGKEGEGDSLGSMSHLKKEESKLL